MAIDPDIFVKGLSALASVLSLASSIRNLTKHDKISEEEAVERLKERVNPGDPISKALSDPDLTASAISVSASVISEKLLSQLLDQATKCEDKHIEGLKNADSITEENRVNDAARQCMCHVLRSMISFNKGTLPDNKIITDWWDSYSCVH